MLLLLASSQAPPAPTPHLHLHACYTYYTLLTILTQDREKEIKKMRGEVPIFTKQACMAWRAQYKGTPAPVDEGEAESDDDRRMSSGLQPSFWPTVKTRPSGRSNLPVEGGAKPSASL